MDRRPAPFWISGFWTAAPCGRRSPPADERMENGWQKIKNSLPGLRMGTQNECCFREQCSELVSKVKPHMFITCRVFPRPMQCASIHPDPCEELASFTDSQQQSHMNWTPGCEERKLKNGSQQWKRAGSRTGSLPMCWAEGQRQATRCSYLPSTWWGFRLVTRFLCTWTSGVLVSSSWSRISLVVMANEPSDTSLLSSICCSLSAKRLHLSSSSLRASWVSERRFSSSIILRIFLRPLGVPLLLSSLSESSLPLCLIKIKITNDQRMVEYQRAHKDTQWQQTPVHWSQTTGYKALVASAQSYSGPPSLQRTIWR